MVDEERKPLHETLELACDLCVGLGAFAVSLTGRIEGLVSDPMLPDDGPARMEQLARSCLSHPAAEGRRLFWNAEVCTDGESAEHLLACVVVPIWVGTLRLGLLGVVDTWLPEPDEHEGAGLCALADDLGATLAPPADALPDGPAPGWPSAGSAGSDGAPLRRAEPRLAAVLDSLTDPLCVSTEAGAVVFANRACADLVGQDPEDLVGWDLEAALGLPNAAAAGRRHAGVAGPWPAVHLVTTVSSSPPGAELAAVDLIDAVDDGVVCLDASGAVVLANRAADRMHGLPHHRSLVGSSLPEVTAFRTEDGQVVQLDDHPGLVAMREGTVCTAHLTVGEEGEGRRHLEVFGRPFLIGGRPGALVVLRDTTAEWTERQRLTQYALHDPLTGLANRYLLLEELRRMLQGLSRRGGSVALVYLDLDDFKRINDEHGHETGDEVLAAVARRLSGAVRSEDVVARLGGDEFVVATAATERVPDGDLVVARIRKVLSAPFRVRGQAFGVEVSAGWVSTDTAVVSPDALLAQADRAMYRHKKDRVLARPSAP